MPCLNIIEMDKFQNKYRIPSARLQSWDYRWAGAYFITICTRDRVQYFGEILNQQMQLSHTGIIADVLWYQILHHAQNVELGEFVVMPNHIHGILIITNDGNGNNNVNGNGNYNDYGNGNVETGHALSLQSVNPSDNPSESIPKIIGKQRFQNIGKIPFRPSWVPINRQ